MLIPNYRSLEEIPWLVLIQRENLMLEEDKTVSV